MRSAVTQSPSVHRLATEQCPSLPSCTAATTPLQATSCFTWSESVCPTIQAVHTASFSVLMHGRPRPHCYVLSHCVLETDVNINWQVWYELFLFFFLGTFYLTFVHFYKRSRTQQSLTYDLSAQGKLNKNIQKYRKKDFFFFFKFSKYDEIKSSSVTEE